MRGPIDSHHVLLSSSPSHVIGIETTMPATHVNNHGFALRRGAICGIEDQPVGRLKYLLLPNGTKLQAQVATRDNRDKLDPLHSCLAEVHACRLVAAAAIIVDQRLRV